MQPRAVRGVIDKTPTTSGEKPTRGEDDLNYGDTTKTLGSRRISPPPGAVTSSVDDDDNAPDEPGDAEAPKTEAAKVDDETPPPVQSSGGKLTRLSSSLKEKLAKASEGGR